jgi:hypothetical protein
MSIVVLTQAGCRRHEGLYHGYHGVQATVEGAFGLPGMRAAQCRITPP